MRQGRSFVMIQCGASQPSKADGSDEVGVWDMTDGRLAYAEDLIRVSRQVVGVVLLSWQRILRVGVITAIAVLLVTEIVACLITSSFPPPPATHLVAVALACALGYGAAVTMLFGMILKGGITFIRYLEGDAEFGVHAASVLARREVDSVRVGMRRVFGGRGGASGGAKSGDTRSRAAKEPQAVGVAHGVAASAAVAAVGLDVARAATPRTKSTPRPLVRLPLGAQSDVRRDPDDAIIRTPAPALQSLPVLATQMPRIGWTYDDNQPQVAPKPSTRSRPIQPIEQPMVAETMPVMTDTIDTAAVQPPTPGAALFISTISAVSPETPVTIDEPDAARGTPDVPGLIPRGWRYNSSATRPQPAVTRPLPKVTQPLSEPGASPTPDSGHPGGLWKRVSQALVGQPDTPESANGERVDQTLPMSDALGDALPQIAPEDAWLIE